MHIRNENVFQRFMYTEKEVIILIELGSVKFCKNFNY